MRPTWSLVRQSVSEFWTCLSSSDSLVMALKKLLNQTIDEMELSVRSHNCLEAAGITLIGELVDKDEAEMLEYKNFGRKSLNELIEKLETMGLKFGMDTSPYVEDEV